MPQAKLLALGSPLTAALPVLKQLAILPPSVTPIMPPQMFESKPPVAEAAAALEQFSIS
jgi:hypothetical protein